MHRTLRQVQAGSETAIPNQCVALSAPPGFWADMDHRIRDGVDDDGSPEQQSRQP